MNGVSFEDAWRQGAEDYKTAYRRVHGRDPEEPSDPGPAPSGPYYWHEKKVHAKASRQEARHKSRQSSPPPKNNHKVKAPSSDLEILGLKDGYSKAELKKAYRRLAKELHPDLGGDSRRFNELNHAYNRLLEVIHD